MSNLSLTLTPEHFEETCLVSACGWLTNGHYLLRLQDLDDTWTLPGDGDGEDVHPLETVAGIGAMRGCVLLPDGTRSQPRRKGLLTTEMLDAVLRGDAELRRCVVSRLVVDTRPGGPLQQLILNDDGHPVASANPEYLDALDLLPGAELWSAGWDLPLYDAHVRSKARRILMGHRSGFLPPIEVPAVLVGGGWGGE